jgi:hypothetical protein
MSDTVDAIERKKSTLAIFLDLSKAFDTINYNIMLGKLAFYGVRGNVYNWIENYLTNRKQYVHYQDSDSVYMDLECGVPQ